MSTDANVPHVTREILRQPEAWTRAAQLAADVAGRAPTGGARRGDRLRHVVVHGRGVRRAARGRGRRARPTPSPRASSPRRRTYDRVVAISRSGTTTEVVRAMQATSARRGDHRRRRLSGRPRPPTTGGPGLRRRAVGGADRVRHDHPDAAARLARARPSSRSIAQARGCSAGSTARSRRTVVGRRSSPSSARAGPTASRRRPR